MHFPRTFTILACLAFCGILPAAAQTGEVEAEVDAALLQLAERGELGSFDQPLKIDRPVQVRYELGAVVDVRKPDPRGLEVLAITPDGAAARMGLKAGDRLVAINDRRLDGDAAPAGLLRDALRDGNGAVQLVAARGKSRIELRGQADAVAIPAYQLTVGEAAADAAPGCGYVSDSAMPPRSKGLFDAEITQIDGRSTPLWNFNRMRVSSGRHVLMIGERIPAHRLGMMENRQRIRTRERLMARIYKPLVVDIKPNTEYRIGVRLHKDKLSFNGIRANEYWEPVVWEQRASTCN